MKRITRAAAVLGAIGGGVSGVAAQDAPPDGFVVRQGYSVSAAIPDLRGARFLEHNGKDLVFVSLPDSGQIATFREKDGGYERLGSFVRGKRTVHGLHYVDGWLWFTTSGGVHKGKDTDGDGVADEVVEVLKGLPSGGHWWRPIFVTPDGFYTSIGDSGNITDETDTDRQKIWKYSLDGSTRTLFASGIRNTEKYRYRPGTMEIWGLDHGSDWFGREVGDVQGAQPVTDLNPPDEFNKYVEGGFYGHPFVTGNRVPRYEYSKKSDIHDLAKRTIPPEWCVGAHWATNGFAFIDPEINARTGALPAELSGDALIAAHGSWNSSKPVGYCVARIMFDKDPSLGGKPIGLMKIVSCIDAEGKVRGRPVDCLQMPDGSVLFSSDSPGRVYRLRGATK